ncbi:hypothetical protein NQ176_g6133 [Zarea fungicola]|uniref:Uncharacterized protein n=1 Tax=Zarea fungicola TaxID=93591 RepID=A0ACC1N5X2_9HYPO|nr:hypothetical protein NQ176_g6133 [Lecanicillium fungicola]
MSNRAKRNEESRIGFYSNWLHLSTSGFFNVDISMLPSVSAVAIRDATQGQVDVTLQAIGNHEVKATIQNNGNEDISFLKPGSIFDSSAVRKVKVTTGVVLTRIFMLDHTVPFLGIKKRISTTKIQDDAIQHIPAGQSIEVSINIAQAHDLSTGGKFNVNAAGSLNIVSADGITGAVSYKSNTVEVQVDGKEASVARHATMMKRSRVQSDCTGQKLQITQQALQNCNSLAKAAQTAATSTRSGVANYYCTDVGDDCGGNVLAYTVPSQSYMVYCDLYFEDLPAVTRQCHAQDQATTNIHEDTHLNQIQGTDDLGYGYSAIRGLSASQELDNADTFALFANAIYAGC